jgi:hypothetical protein
MLAQKDPQRRHLALQAQVRHSPPVGGALAIWHKRCSSLSAHVPQAAKAGSRFSDNPRALRMRWAKHVCRRLTQS